MPVKPINTSLNDRVSAFAKAGNILSQYLTTDHSKIDINENLWDITIKQTLTLAEQKNSWFTRDNLLYALEQWSKALTEENLSDWLKPYHLENVTPKKVAVIAAGNIPLVGFHDVLCIILTGHFAQIKTSSNDDVLLPMMLKLAGADLPALENSYEFTDGRLTDFDAVIATGSNNTARYFEHYFGKKPNIIRKNRNSIAVLTGNETHEQLVALSDDVFLFFGLGCRSVSHLKVPSDYDFDAFFKAMYEKRELINYIKYSNNYDYNKAVYLMSEFKLLDNEFLIIKEEIESYASPIASLGYSYYSSDEEIQNEIHTNAEDLQCVVADSEIQKTLQPVVGELAAPQLVDFGETQKPALDDYADGLDTIHFLLTLS
ncbi:Acyl-CoA reductase (LuxC) [Nonlabens sp. Hel1_33_55]|uniref:acyl-CoA reductase n=1 Tax=Nonlabens sp. Hel1_33_55 TaxID=1336802 RepID=UPI000875DF94|nr:acyl-CoA reductase [Nonlabens sp. Hel1_33_55]SCY10236.1 Acyl-CoA reductase (LuxC) [Nonlabens sp. Hel1_33_55]